MRKTGVEAAVNWMLEHEGDADIDTPLLVTQACGGQQRFYAMFKCNVQMHQQCPEVLMRNRSKSDSSTHQHNHGWCRTQIVCAVHWQHGSRLTFWAIAAAMHYVWHACTLSSGIDT
jgi:hypothetical protein